MGRSPCCDKSGLKKGPWTPEEDAKLTQHIQTHGPGNWRTLPKIAGLQRCGKSCRLRWTNYLRPDIKRGRFSFEEEETIIQLHSVLGNKWSAIAARLPGRTDNEIKNYWNTHIRKRLLRMRIDPVTHAPRLDLSDLSSLLTSPQLNLSNLIRLQTLVNPEALRVALTLISSSQNDQNQLLNSHHQQIQNLQAPVIQPNHFDNNIINQPIPWTFATSSLHNQSQSHMHMGHVPMGSTNSSAAQVLLFHDNLTSASDQTKADLSSDNNSSFETLNSNSNNSQNFSFDSVVSTPPNTAAALVSGSTEDERDSFCSNLFQFEFNESFDFDDFM